MSGHEIAQRSTRGSVVLFAGNFLSTAFLAVSSIIVARLLGPASYGSYTLVLRDTPDSPALRGLGVSSAITRFSAYYIARGGLGVAKRFSINSMVFLMLFGVALSVGLLRGRRSSSRRSSCTGRSWRRSSDTSR